MVKIFGIVLGLGVFFKNAPALAQAGTSSPDSLGFFLVQALQTERTEALTALLPPVSLFALIAPEETEGLSEAEKEALALRLARRQSERLEMLLQEARKARLSTILLSPENIEAQPLPFSQAPLYGVEVRMKHPSRRNYTLLLVALYHQNRWYWIDLAAEQPGFLPRRP
ncbi:MAG: hypothetical protein HC913_08475 [Microscillaceae bacterium]|nr:hypothetical protein [Microscillaceae bacterium]